MAVDSMVVRNRNDQRAHTSCAVAALVPEVPSIRSRNDRSKDDSMAQFFLSLTHGIHYTLHVGFPPAVSRKNVSDMAVTS
jgi:hypothetical protein